MFWVSHNNDFVEKYCKRKENSEKELVVIMKESLIIYFSVKKFLVWRCSGNVFFRQEMMTTLRQEVLNLYRQVLRLSRKWESTLRTPEATETERNYIADEAKKLFRKNKYVSPPL